MTYQTVTSTSGSDAVITLPAVSGIGYVVTNIAASYSGTTASTSGTENLLTGAISLSTTETYGSLTVKIGSALIFDMYVASGEFVILNENFPTDMHNESLEIRLTGISNVFGKISIAYVTD